MSNSSYIDIAITSAVLNSLAVAVIIYKTVRTPTSLRAWCLFNGISLCLFSVVTVVHTFTQDSVPPVVNEIIYRNTFMLVTVMYTITLTLVLMRLRSRFVPHEKKHNGYYWAIIVVTTIFTILAVVYSIFETFVVPTIDLGEHIVNIFDTLQHAAVLILGLISVILAYCYVFFPLLKMKKERIINKDAFAVSIWYLSLVALMIVGWLPLHIVTWTSDAKGLNVNGLEGLDCLIRMYLVVGLSLPPPNLAIQMIQRCFTSQMASHLDLSSIIQTAPINSSPVLPLVSPTKPTDTTQVSPEPETQIQITVELPRAPSPAVFRPQHARSFSGTIFSRADSPTTRHKPSESNKSLSHIDDDYSSLTLCMAHGTEPSDDESQQSLE
ncbi:hypothetical protein BC938DRAFT_474725 [Jimgerdemannia flammicorona]|uniref:G-protein coupled receptors family 3 profile domain-containing protein n=1 Tax=Jimgerdemannia flammicorona TaxID=994334 RepID=A0A433Q1N2_9FUNG|nr:hypothetical protein BC938DRAFT_474725 [Jimgerdemannia flammicorona]